MGSQRSAQDTVLTDQMPLPTSPALAQGALSPNSALSKLERLLEAKSEEIQMAGRLGERLLMQQSELESKINELEGLMGPQDSDEESVPGGHQDVSEQVKQNLQALESEMASWSTGNDELYHQLAKPHAQTESAEVRLQLFLCMNAAASNYFFRILYRSHSPAAEPERPKIRAPMIWSLPLKLDSPYSSK